MIKPDFSFSVSNLSQFMDAPRQRHWKAACRVLLYLKNSSDKEITYNKSSHYQLTTFTKLVLASMDAPLQAIVPF